MEVPRRWRTQSARYGLVGVVCDRCGRKSFPPRELCPECHAPTPCRYQFSGRGEVYSYSTVFQGPDGFADSTPYIVALVKLDEGPLVVAQLTEIDRADLRIGMAVEVVTRRLRDTGPRGIVLYGYKFRPPLVAQPE